MGSNAAINHWETYLKGMTPCRFPRFRRPGREPTALARQVSSTRVNVEQADRLLELSTTDPEGLGAVLRTAWALLLRCYTGQDDISFAFQHGGDVAGEPIVARFLLDDSASVGGTVGRAKVEHGRDLPPVPTRLLRSGHSDGPLIDTALVVWSFTKRSTPCQVLEPVCIHFHDSIQQHRRLFHKPMLNQP